MALLRKAFTRAQHRSHTKRVCEFQLFLHFLVPSTLTKDRVLHYLPRQVKFYSLSFRVIEIKRLFIATKLYIILKGIILPNTWASQQHKYLKHGGREPVSSK